VRESNDYSKDFIPYAVWTGSFNLTNISGKNMENAIYIEDPIIAKKYTNMWKQIFVLSEPLHWKHDTCTPNFNIVTILEEEYFCPSNTNKKKITKELNT